MAYSMLLFWQHERRDDASIVLHGPVEGVIGWADLCCLSLPGRTGDNETAAQITAERQALGLCDGFSAGLLFSADANLNDLCSGHWRAFLLL